MAWVWLFQRELLAWRGGGGGLGVVRRVWVRVRLPFRTVLSCEIRDRRKEASVEEYAADGLAASGQPGMRPAGMAAVAAAAEAVEPGTGPLVVRLIGLVRAAAGAVRLEEIEVLAVEGARDLGRGALQLALDAQADAEVLLPGLTGADGCA